MPETRLKLKPASTGIDVAIHVQPRARRNEISGLHNGALKLKVVAPPVEDAANRAVIQFFASLLNVPKSRLKIISGEKSRDKMLRLEGVSQPDLLSHLPPGLL
jgi:hypothetical protein